MCQDQGAGGSDPSHTGRSPQARGCSCGERPWVLPLGCGPQAWQGHKPGPAGHRGSTPRTLPAALSLPPWHGPGPARPGAWSAGPPAGPGGGCVGPPAHPGSESRSGSGVRVGGGTDLASARPALSAELTPALMCSAQLASSQGREGGGPGGKVWPLGRDGGWGGRPRAPRTQLDSPWACATQRDPHTLAMGWDQ